jgi:hypothetical protein
VPGSYAIQVGWVFVGEGFGELEDGGEVWGCFLAGLPLEAFDRCPDVVCDVKAFVAAVGEGVAVCGFEFSVGEFVVWELLPEFLCAADFAGFAPGVESVGLLLVASE